MRNLLMTFAAVACLSLTLAPRALADEVPDPPASSDEEEGGGGGGCSASHNESPLSAGLALGGLAATIALLSARRRRDA